MFYDLNVKLNKSKSSNNVLDEILTQLLEYGYRGVALTVEVDDSIFISKKDKPKKSKPSPENELIPPPPNIKTLEEKFPKLKIYKRINVVLSESDNIRKVVQSKNLRHYDIVSFQPENQNVLKSLIGVPDVDIISYNPESKCTFAINRKLYNQFVNQNVYFELLYTPAVNSQSARKNLITLSHIYHAVGKSKNIVVNSGCELPQHIRGPYDIMNFNLLFGLSEEQAKSAISRNSEKLILKARKQRQGKEMVEIRVISDDKKPEEPMEVEAT